MHGLAILFWTYLFRFNLVFCFSTYPEHWKCSTIFSVFFSSLSRILTWLGLTRGGNEIGVFVNTYRGGFCEHELTDFHETFQVTSYHLTWHFETKMVSQSFLVFQLEPFYGNLPILEAVRILILEHFTIELKGWNLNQSFGRL